jgi:hypothetical protein
VTAVAPGVDRLPVDQALPEALRAQVTGFARAAAGDTIYRDRRRPSDEGREP